MQANMIMEKENEEVIEKPSKEAEFVLKIETLLENDGVGDAWVLATDKNNKNMIEKCTQELFPVLNRYLTQENKKDQALNYEFCKSFVFQIVNNCQPDEILLEILEVAERADVCGMSVYLEALQICLQKLPRKRGTSIAWVCNTVVRFLCEMDLPKEIEDEESNGCDLNENCKEAKDIEQMYTAVLNFFEPFVTEIEMGMLEMPEKHRKQYKNAILECLLKLLGRPLAYLDLNETEIPSKFRFIANRIIKFLSSFKFDPLHYLNFVDPSCSVYDALSSMTVDAQYTNLSLGMYFFLLFKHQINIEKISYVYSTEFLLENILTLTQDMISTRDGPIQLKATDLISSILSRISSKTMDLKSITHTSVSKFLEILTHTMVYNDIKLIRQRCVQIFKTFIMKFQSEGRYMILASLKKTEDPGLIGFGLTILKDLIADSLTTKDPDDLKQFTGKKLIWFLKLFCVLEEKTDLVRISDRIISTLNLIRFILIRDKENITGFGNYLDELEGLYLYPLKEKLEFSRHQHVIEVDGLRKCLERGNDKKTLESLGCPQDIPLESQIQSLDEAITIIDLMDDIHSRVMTFVDSYKTDSTNNIESVQ